MSDRMLFMCFAVGLNNFASGRERTSTLIAWVEPALARLCGEVVNWYGSTGNVAISAESSGREISALLYEMTRRQWAVIESNQVRLALERLNDYRGMVVEHGDKTRLTPGLAFPVRGSSTSIPLKRTWRADLWWISPEVVGVCKADALTQQGTLDSSERRGGWGAISRDIEKQVVT